VAVSCLVVLTIVSQDISSLLSLASNSISLLTLPQTDGPGDNLPQNDERSELFVSEVTKYFDALDVRIRARHFCPCLPFLRTYNFRYEHVSLNFVVIALHHLRLKLFLLVLSPLRLGSVFRTKARPLPSPHRKTRACKRFEWNETRGRASWRLCKDSRLLKREDKTESETYLWNLRSVLNLL